jgi:hypothetical protein
LNESFQELKDEVFRKLARHPKIEAFFKDSLEKRMKLDDNWIENTLVLLLLDDRSFKNSALHPLIDSIYNDQKNFNILRKKLKPNDQYDDKILDVFAELNGYYHLVECGFEKILALPEDDQQKKPDFSAELNGEPYLFEVKNIRAPVEVCDLLFKKTEARFHKFPEIYKNVIISYTLSKKWRQIEFNCSKTEDLKKIVEGWLNKEVFITVESLESASPRPFSSSIQDLVIECSLHQGPKFGQVCGFIDYVNADDPIYRESILSPFENKIHRVSCYASQQLLEYDKTKQHKKYVLLNWQQRKESTIPIWNGFEDDVLAIVRNIDNNFQDAHNNLFVRLLNFDPLP